MPTTQPAKAWQSLKEGNQRFVEGLMEHPSQDVTRRSQLVVSQHPRVVLFGCSDSRVAAELIFDQGLGDMFVVRTAGHILDGAVIGSLEYATEVVDVPLILVLGHDHCGAVKETIAALDGAGVPDGFLRDVVEKVTPSILKGRQEGLTAVDALEARHVRETMWQIMQRSGAIADKVLARRLAIVGVTYQLHDGRANLKYSIGDIGEDSNARTRYPTRSQVYGNRFRPLDEAAADAGKAGGEEAADSSHLRLSR